MLSRTLDAIVRLGGVGWLASAVVACGGVTRPVATLPEAPAMTCSGARAEAGGTWSRLAVAAEALAETTGPEADVANAALARLEGHAAALAETPAAVSEADAIALSNVLLDALDTLEGEAPRALRDGAEDAAEALLAERGPASSARAARAAADALSALLGATQPGWAEARAGASALSNVGARARRMAMALEQGSPPSSEELEGALRAGESQPGLASQVAEARASLERLASVCSEQDGSPRP